MVVVVVVSFRKGGAGGGSGVDFRWLWVQVRQTSPGKAQKSLAAGGVRVDYDNVLCK